MAPMPVLRCAITAIFLFAMVVETTPAGTHPRSAALWRTMAKRDLKAAHTVIGAAHPGIIDDQNPKFKIWYESGYREALSLVPRIVDYETMLSVVSYYTTGFRDGHLAYSDDIRSNESTIAVDGWHVTFAYGKYVVDQALSNWPVSLPSAGSQLIACDGRSPKAIIRKIDAPFVDRRRDASAMRAQANALWIKHLSGFELHRCKFRETNGSEFDLPVVYRPLTTEQFFESIKKNVRQGNASRNYYKRVGDTLWIRAATFNLQPGTLQAVNLSAMLKSLSHQTGIKTMVFDVRGNLGGDSNVGKRTFDAATGGLVYDHKDLTRLKKTYAQWRVSEVLLSTSKYWASRTVKLYGKDDPETAVATNFLKSVEAAKVAGRKWVNQEDGYRLTPAEVAKRHGKLLGFDGKVAAVADSSCVSACLDFLNLVRQVPGSIQLGEPTSSDTVYMDASIVGLPSGNHLMLPLKVWRNRTRKNDEAYEPDITLHVNMNDDAAVQAAVLHALGRGS